MMKNNLDNMKRIYSLIVGLLLVVAGGVIIAVTNKDISLLQNPSTQFLQGWTLWVLLICVCVVAPVLEEIIFRYWVKGNLLSKIIATVFIPLVVGITFNWIVGSISLIVIIFLLYFLRSSNLRFIFMGIISTLAFGMAHLGNYNSSGGAIGEIMIICGIGAILLYIMARWNIWAAICVHAVYNFMMLILSGIILLSSPTPESFAFDNFSAKIVQTQNWTGWYSASSMYVYKDGQLEMSSVTMSDILKYMSQDSTQYVYAGNTDSRTYNLVASTNQSHDMIALRDSIIKRYSITLDTICLPENYFILRFNRDSINCGIHRGFMSVSHVITPVLNRNLGVNVVSNDIVVRMYPDNYFKLRREKNLNEVISIFEEEQITLEKAGNEPRFVIITNSK